MYFKQGYISLCLIIIIVPTASSIATKEVCSREDYTLCYNVPEFKKSIYEYGCPCQLYGLDMPVCGDFLQLSENITENVSETSPAFEYVIDNSTTSANDTMESRYIRFLTFNTKCLKFTNSLWDNAYPVISKCPAVWEDEAIRTQCDNPSQNTPPIQFNVTFIFVFKNIFCALCHGLTEDFIRNNAIVWKPVLTCNSNSDSHLLLEDHKPQIDESHCSSTYTQPKNINYRADLQNAINIINYDCMLCADDIHQDENTTSINCMVCQFGILLFEWETLPSLPFESLSVLFQIPTQKEQDILINGGIFRSSQICKDDENLDLLYQRCRKFVCPAGQFALQGQCLEESNVFVSPDSQPFPYNSDTFHLNVTFKGRVQSLMNVILLMINSNVELEFMEDIVTNEDGNEFTSIKIKSKIPVTRLLYIWSKQGIYLLSKVVLSIQMTNMDKSANSTCLNTEFQCIENPSVYFLNSKPFSRIDSGSIRFMYPLDNIMFDLTIDRENSSLAFSEVCVCLQKIESNNLTASINCPGLLYEYTADEYILIRNDTLELVEEKLRFDDRQFYIRGNVAVICHDGLDLKDFEFFKLDEIQGYVSIACTAISVFFLVISLVLFAMFKELRTLPGKMTASLSVLLIIAQCLLYLPQMDTGVCKYIAAFTHYCWLSVFLWMSCIGGNMVITFHPTLMVANRALKGNNAYWRYCVIALVCPVILCVVLLVLDSIEGDHFHINYGEISCVWIGDRNGFIFAFFVLIALSLVFNIVCFCITLYEIEKSMKTSDDVTGRKRERSRCHMYIRLSSVMGFSWIFGFLAVFGDIPLLWYVFIVLNGLQGVFIFISFSVNARTRGLLRSWISQRTFSSVLRSHDEATPKT